MNKFYTCDTAFSLRVFSYIYFGCSSLLRLRILVSFESLPDCPTSCKVLFVILWYRRGLTYNEYGSDNPELP